MELTLEIALQTSLAFFAIFFFARLVGKKQVSELTFYDYINGITFGSIAANLVTDTDQHQADDCAAERVDGYINTRPECAP